MSHRAELNPAESDLFDSVDPARPLADRMRPRALGEFTGQQHLLGPQRPLRRAIEGGHLQSMVLWGPPGTGKTTLARLIAQGAQAEWMQLSAVFAGVKDIRAAIDRAERVRKQWGRRSVLFVDEVHRFNKAQQDAFLPKVEDGTLTFIGATTENPSFSLNNALLSRVRVYVLKPLHQDDLIAVLRRAVADRDDGLGSESLALDPEAEAIFAAAADGDARRGLTFLEMAADLAEECEANRKAIDPRLAREIVSEGTRRFDRQGDAFYDQISALHKSVRGSDPDAALYWLARMLDGGCDPLYVARRVVRMASEDIGNADPQALAVALHAWEAQERLGSPEGELALAQAVVYLACAPKSNAIYTALAAVLDDVKQHGSLEVPMHLRNAPTRLMRELGYGGTYRYDHDEPNAFAAGQQYLPDPLQGRCYYAPTDRGREAEVAPLLQAWRAARADKAR